VKGKFDFSGYATKNDVQCSDGRIIHKDAFKDNHGQTVPLVWQHLHNDPNNVLGHAVLENREDGVYAFCLFNGTKQGMQGKELVQHGDITALSIFANKLKQKGNSVLHGAIREVSLVLSGANPGALIDNLCIEHADGTEDTIDPTEAIIYSGMKISLDNIEIEHAEGGDKTIQDIFDGFTEEQKDVVYALIAHAVDAEGESDEEISASDIAKINAYIKGGGEELKHNVFDNEDQKPNKNTLTHAQVQEIFVAAQKCGSFKEAFLAHTVTYGIEYIDYLFPDAKTITSSPEFLSRRMEWVTGVINGTKHSPFSRIKTLYADITGADARAKGYIKGTQKENEFFALYKRSTTPSTIYKKQKLDRDDIIDITDLDVVAWLKAEMRIMLDEEIARALLVGDGRTIMDNDKIDESTIRPIYSDADIYAHHVTIDSDHEIDEVIEDIIRARKEYKGSGSPTFYTTSDMLTDMLLSKDSLGRRLYPTVAELCSVLRVSNIVEVPVMEALTRDITDPAPATLALLGIIVNLSDYTLGADKGGAVSMFDDFDIDYNQYKYLIETRCSGALTKLKSALVIEQIQT